MVLQDLLISLMDVALAIIQGLWCLESLAWCMSLQDGGEIRRVWADSVKGRVVFGGHWIRFPNSYSGKCELSGFGMCLGSGGRCILEQGIKSFGWVGDLLCCRINSFKTLGFFVFHNASH